MRYIRYAILGVLGIVFICVFLANRQIVTVRLLPEGLVNIPLIGAFDWQIELPLFLIMIGAIAIGFLVGYVWEWLREYRARAESGRRGHEVQKLRREVKRLKETEAEGKDDVLAMLEDSR